MLQTVALTASKPSSMISLKLKLSWAVVDRAADSGPCDPSSIPLGEKKEKKRKEKEAGVGPYLKKP